MQNFSVIKILIYLIYLLAADRIGIERNVYLLGCSCIVKLGVKSNIIDYLDKNTTDVIVHDLEF